MATIALKLNTLKLNSLKLSTAARTPRPTASLGRALARRFDLAAVLTLMASSAAYAAWTPLLPRGLPDFSPGEGFVRQWAALGFSPDGHPVGLLRDALGAAGVTPCAALQETGAGRCS